MRPLRLTIEGFTSFREPQEIDFRELDLFVITGPTGSGKTSILDAVALALYGMVPRAGKRDLKELISLGASQTKVQLEFRAGDDEYRVARRIRRQGAQAATLERIEGEDAVPEVERGGVKAVNERVVEILGLDYPSFTTAVLLPQGAFASFLKGDVKERRNILIRLLDLDRFRRAGGLARERASGLRTAVEAREELIAREYADATPETLAETRERSETAAKAAERVEAALDEARAQLSQREETDARRSEVLAAADTLQAQEAELAALAAELAEKGGRDEETRNALRSAERARFEAREARDRARAAWRETMEETGDEGLLAQLQAAAETLSEAAREIDRRSDELATNAAALKEGEARAQRLRERQASADEAETAAAKAREAATEAREAAEEALRVARRADELGRQHEAKAKALERLRSEVDAAESRRAEAGRERDRRDRELRVAETAHRAAGLRAGLAPGEKCPVCGVPVEELPATDPEIESVLATHEAAAEAAREEALGAEKRLSTARARLEAEDAAAKNLDERLGALGDVPVPDQAEAARARAVEAEDAAAAALEAARKRARAIRAEASEAKAELAGIEATRKAAEEARDGALKRVEAATERLVAGLGEPLPDPVDEAIEARRRRLRASTAARDAAEATWEAAETSYRAAEDERNTVATELAALDRRRTEHRTLLGTRRERLDRLGVALPAPGAAPDAAVAAPPDSPLEAPPGLASDSSPDAAPGTAPGPLAGPLADAPPDSAPPDAESRDRETAGLRAHADALRRAARQHADELASAIAALDTAIRAHAASGLDDAASVSHLDAAAAVSALDASARAARRAADQCAQELQQLEERLKRKAEMEAEIEDKRGRMRRFEKVARELQTNRFIGFLLDESIEDLAHRASDELREISAGQYSLASSENNFEVVDHANADEHRSVVTLSGGETFLASLALALGLAGGIADIAGHSAGARLDAMFIDEGFGTLDPESLDQAVEALERLRDGRRMVGIITHVPTLADRIPDGLTVIRQSGHTAVVPR